MLVVPELETELRILRSCGTTMQARDRNVYTLVQQDGTWLVQSDAHPDQPPAAPGQQPAAPGAGRSLYD